jgi:hypothetical protein
VSETMRDDADQGLACIHDLMGRYRLRHTCFSGIPQTKQNVCVITVLAATARKVLN